MLHTRRAILVNGIRLGLCVPALPELALARRGMRGDGRVLVVVQLTGGNDGLNTLVPHRQDDYYRLRPTLALPPEALHRLDADHGLHPDMGGLAELYRAGKLAVVHGVGHAQMGRSHFRALEVWHASSLAEPAPEVGWLGRLADRIAAREPGALPAIHVGGSALPLALRGESVLPPSLRDADAFRLHPRARDLVAARDAILARSGGSGELDYLRRAARGAYAFAARIEELAARPTAEDYPGSDLARRLRLVARLISGDLGTRVFHVEQVGFDTHVRQARSHARLLRELSQALFAFQRDLERQGADERVATLVFSEFGRRVQENGSRGTDHGAGAPVLLLGPRLRSGLHGNPPDLSALEEGDVPATTDFRAVHAALERDWLGFAPSSPVPALELVAL